SRWSSISSGRGAVVIGLRAVTIFLTIRSQNRERSDRVLFVRSFVWFRGFKKPILTATNTKEATLAGSNQNDLHFLFNNILVSRRHRVCRCSLIIPTYA